MLIGLSLAKKMEYSRLLFACEDDMVKFAESIRMSPFKFVLQFPVIRLVPGYYEPKELYHL